MSSSQSLPCGDAKSAVTNAEPSAGFTPGPWTAERGHAVGLGAPVIAHGPGAHVAWVTRGSPGGGWPDARLIAAAPDLYEALDSLLDACIAEFGEPDDDDEDDEPVGWGEVAPGSGIGVGMAVTFGMLRRALAALAKVSPPLAAQDTTDRPTEPREAN